MKYIVEVVLLALVASVNVQALEQTGGKNIRFECKMDDAEDSKYFPGIQKNAREINQQICDVILVPTRKSIKDDFPRDEVAAFGSLVKERATARFGNVELDNLPEQLNYFKTTLTTGAALPSFVIKPNPQGPREPIKYFYFFAGNQNQEGNLTLANNEKCLTDETLNAECNVVLDQLVEAIYPYQRNQNAFTAYETRVKLNALAKDWDAYFDGARAQTFADIVVTTFLEENHFSKDYLVGPPERQWFVLHPNVVLESVNAAPDGDNLTAALSIEWIGVNWWQDTVIGVPFGVSLASVYSDRPGVNDVGHGATFYFDNKYMIGYANHGGDHGFYISMDLLKLFENEKEQAERYRNRIKGIVGID